MALVCDGYYDCDNYEDESSCNNSATYLQEGESHSIYIPLSFTRRLYNATLLQTKTTYGFRIMFQYLYLYYDDDKFQIGTGNDPSDIQSVITTIHGLIDYSYYDVYVDTDEMWIAVIGGNASARIEMDVEIISVDLSNLLQCRTSGISFTTNDLCDGVFKCPDFADEAQCSHPSTFLLENENHTITFPDIYEQMYNASFLKTNSANGFRVKFLAIYLECYAHEYGYTNYCDDANIQIGTGNDTTNSQSIVKTVRAYTSYEDDVYVGSNEMWITVVGFLRYRPYTFYGRVEIEVTPISLSSIESCSNSR
eukprot:XP_011664111.1 PREDICTED: uncharacterized protein LOC105438239 [Strongylocentrotus purpuratus]